MHTEGGSPLEKHIHYDKTNSLDLRRSLSSVEYPETPALLVFDRIYSTLQISENGEKVNANHKKAAIHHADPITPHNDVVL